jgi:acetolactate synthase-1/2/3 large subunit
VLLSVPEDLLDAKVPSRAACRRIRPHPEHQAEPDPVLVRKVLHLLADARRPLILAGAGVLAGAQHGRAGSFRGDDAVPVVSSWRRGDVFPNDNPLYLGMTGLGRLPASWPGWRKPTRSSCWAAGWARSPRTGTDPGARDALGAGRRGASRRRVANRPEIVMAADVAAFLRWLSESWPGRARRGSLRRADGASNAADREAFEAGSVVDAEPWDGPGVHPGRVVATLARVLPAEAILTTDAGDFGTWAARGYRFHRPGTFLGSTAGPMGYGLPAAIGATLARPGRLGVALAGDGGFAMTMAELETAVRERAHVVAIVFDNGRYGTIWRHQTQARRSGRPRHQTRRGDFAAIAEACGALGLAVNSDDEFEPALRRAMESGRPALLHLALDPRWTTPDHLPSAVAADVETDEVATAVEWAETGEVADVPDVGEIPEVTETPESVADESPEATTETPPEVAEESDGGARDGTRGRGFGSGANLRPVGAATGGIAPAATARQRT